MESIITFENIRSFAYVNNSICKTPIRGVVLNFLGLGSIVKYDEDTEEGRYFAESGILYVTPYTNPWSWMNWQAVCCTDEILDVLFDHYQLPDDLPVVSTGGSMGGLSALVYMVYAKRTPVACLANCPVCDAACFCADEPDVPRTLYSALWNEETSFEEAMKSVSPIHLVDKLPDVAYTIYHCEGDQRVLKKRHSDPFVKELKKSHRVDYIEVPGRSHCDIGPELRAEFMATARIAILYR